jgi:hypothetical protein
MGKNRDIVVGGDSCTVFGTEVPVEYLEGHRESLLYLVGILEAQGFDPQVNTITFSPGADGDPGPNGEPAGKGGDITFSIEDVEYLRLSNREVSLHGIVQDQSDPVAHAIAVYSGLREFLQVSKTLKEQKDSA